MSPHMAEVEAKRTYTACLGAGFGMCLLLFAGGAMVFDKPVFDAPDRRLQVTSPGIGTSLPGTVSVLATTTNPWESMWNHDTFSDQLKNASSSGSLKSLASSDSSFNSLDSSKSLESGSFKNMNAVQFGTWESFVIGIAHWCVTGLLALCVACCYKSKVVDQAGFLPQQGESFKDDFDYGLCACFQDINYCCITMCCPAIRIAHTNNVTQVCGGFWPTLISMLCCSLASCVAGPCCLQVYFRMHVKDNMGLQDHPCNDLCVTCFCFACSIGQQAMSVDSAAGYKYKCPCSLDRYGGYGGLNYGYS